MAGRLLQSISPLFALLWPVAPHATCRCCWPCQTATSARRNSCSDTLAAHHCATFITKLNTGCCGAVHGAASTILTMYTRCTANHIRGCGETQNFQACAEVRWPCSNKWQRRLRQRATPHLSLGRHRHRQRRPHCHGQ